MSPRAPSIKIVSAPTEQEKRIAQNRYNTWRFVQPGLLDADTFLGSLDFGFAIQWKALCMTLEEQNYRGSVFAVGSLTMPAEVRNAYAIAKEKYTTIPDLDLLFSQRTQYYPEQLAKIARKTFSPNQMYAHYETIIIGKNDGCRVHLIPALQINGQMIPPRELLQRLKKYHTPCVRLYASH